MSLPSWVTTWWSGRLRQEAGLSAARPLAFQEDGVRLSMRGLTRLRSAASGLGLSPTRRALSAQAGGYVSVYRGRGMEFEESRLYQPGDDIRNMDWRVTARSGRPHTKVFQEERERPVLLVVDQSPGMHFGTRRRLKSVQAARAGAVLAWAAAENGDRVGGMTVSVQRHTDLRPTARDRGVLHLLHALVDGHDPEARGQTPGDALAAPLNRLVYVTRPGSLIFLISDFQGLGGQCRRLVARLARHNDVIGCVVYDPLEAEPPPPGRYRISDGRRSAVLDTRDRRLVEVYRRRFHERMDDLDGYFTRHDMHLMNLATDAPLVQTLRHGLRARPGAMGLP